MMKKVTIHDINGIRIIAVDNEAFDWALEPDDFTAVKNNPSIKESLLTNIQKHFVDCFGEFIGRPTTLSEINISLKEGWIEA